MITGIKTTPPRSGPYCQGECVAYPYTAVAAFVPRDYLRMYPALLMTVIFVALSVYIHHWVPPARRLFSAIGVCLTVIAAVALVLDYAVQLTVMQGSLRAGETAGLSLLSQYNPHGLFIGLENVGYATFAFGFVSLGVALVAHESKLARAAAWVFIAGGALTVLLLVALASIYGTGLEYRFEVMALLVTWLVLVTVGFCSVSRSHVAGRRRRSDRGHDRSCPRKAVSRLVNSSSLISPRAKRAASCCSGEP